MQNAQTTSSNRRRLSDKKDTRSPSPAMAIRQQEAHKPAIEDKVNEKKEVKPLVSESPVLPAQVQGSDRKAPVTHKDLTIHYLMSGAEAITPLLNDHTDPVAALDRMIDTFIENNQDATELQSLREVYADLRNIGQPGRAPVKLGDFRDYRVQQTGDEDGDLFVRIPLGVLGVRRGEKVRANFQDGRILVTKAG